MSELETRTRQSATRAPAGHRERLRELIVQRALRIGPILLSNGRQANYYFDCKRVTLNPEGASLVADAFLEVLTTLQEKPSAIGGLTHGADPIIGSVMMRALEHGLHYEGFYVRKEPKEHGTKQWIENPPAAGSSVVIVDDVVTSGASVIRAIESMELARCNVVSIICLVDREEGGRRAIQRKCPNYVAIFKLSDFPEIIAS